MKVAIVGSRDFPDLTKVIDYVMALDIGDVIVSGGARGVDQAAESAGKARGMRVESLKPDYRTWGKVLAPRLRNSEIVKHADRMVAFLYLESSGTVDAIMKAYRKGIPVEVRT